MATWVNLLDITYPIESIYLSKPSTFPASITINIAPKYKAVFY